MHSNRPPSRRRAPAGLAVLVALALSGCATPGTGDPRDPLEPLNRGIYEVITKFPHKVYFDIDKKGADDRYLETIKLIIQK
jgi:hypothetical protein